MRRGKGECLCPLSPPLPWGLLRAVDPGGCHSSSLRAPRLGPWHKEKKHGGAAELEQTRGRGTQGPGGGLT